jgi:hypothetical protein
MSRSTVGLRLMDLEGLIRVRAGVSSRRRGWGAARMSDHAGAARDPA